MGETEGKVPAKSLDGPNAPRVEADERKRTKLGPIRERVPVPRLSSAPPFAAVARSAKAPAARGSSTAAASPVSTAATSRGFAQIALSAPAPAPSLPASAAALLAVSNSSDPLERDADEAAERVVRRLISAPAGNPVDGSSSDVPPAIALARSTGPQLHRASLVDVVAETAGIVPRGDKAAGFIVEDGTEALTAGQMTKTAFLDELRKVAVEAAERELSKVGRSTEGCPYIEQMISRYAKRPAATLERAIRRYAPATSRAASASEYLPIVGDKLAKGVAEWAKSGNLPDDLPDELKPGQLSGFLEVGASLGRAAAGIGRALLKANPGGGKTRVDTGALAERLGPGRPLEGSARSRMEWAFGRRFDHVKVHADESAEGLAHDLDARAFTVGDHVAFGAGQYTPGTPAGDALLAHELAHVVQQQEPLDRAAPTAALRDGSAAGDSLEEDADSAAAEAVVDLWRQRDPERRPRTRAGIGTRFRSSLQLQRCKEEPKFVPYKSGLPDPHSGLDIPDAEKADRIRKLLDPAGSTSSGGQTTWDGQTGQNKADENRIKLKDAVTAGVKGYLGPFQTTVDALKGAKKIPMQKDVGGKDRGVQGVAEAARGAVEKTYDVALSAAASTPAQLTARSTPMKGAAPDQNVFDASSKADRTAAGLDVSNLAVMTALWIATSGDAVSKEALSTHNLVYGRNNDYSNEETKFLWNEVLMPLTADPVLKAQLEDYALFQLNTAAPGGKIIVQRTIDPSEPDAAKAEIKQRWGIFMVAVHEILHTRTHPAFSLARNSPVALEGFTSYFTKDCCDHALDRVRDKKDEALRLDVEADVATKEPDSSLIPNEHVVPDQYKDHYDNAVKIAAEIGMSGMRAVYFGGHVEYLGLEADGKVRSDLLPKGTARKLNVPLGVSDFAQLVAASGVDPKQILADNPGIDKAIIFPTEAVLRGCREHHVVEAEVSGVKKTETIAQIATQNGVKVADLQRANPDILKDPNAELFKGTRVLIPVH